MSPVIGTILMVAVTVMMSAGVYVWTNVFNETDQAPEAVSVRATGLDRDTDGQVDWVRLTLISAKDAPFHPDILGLQLLPPSTSVASDASLLCGSFQLETNETGTFNECHPEAAATDPWNVGSSIFVPCQESGKHLLTLQVRGHIVLDTRITCNEAATEAIS